MGSLSSRPSVPKTKTVIVSAPVAAQTSSGSSAAPPASSASASAAASAAPAPQASAEARAENLLSRDRSRFGTIQTGFRGLLGLIDPAAGRKTLLGE